MNYLPVNKTIRFKAGLRATPLILIGFLCSLWTPGFWRVGSGMDGWALSEVKAAQKEPEARTLEMGRPMTGELSGAQRHSYQLMLSAGQYLRVTVEQRGVNLAALTFGPDDKQIAEFDSETTTQGQETVTQVAEATGRHRLILQARQPGAPAGGYEIRIAELRAATEQERVIEQARRLNVEYLALYNAGRYGDAQPLGERVVELLEAGWGPEHLDVARSLDNLANLYSDQGEYAKAEPIFRRALAIKEKKLGPEHPAVAATLTNLANHYLAQDDYLQAEPLHRRAIEIKVKTLGPEHLDVALSLDNLGLVYCGIGDYVRAEPLHLRALAIKEKAVGPEHRSVSYSLNNIANVYWELGDYSKAERFYERSLAIKEKTLGPDHPGVASTLHNLATVYYHRGDLLRAEPMHQRALGIKEKALGPDHPSVANSLDSLASLYHAAGDYKRAEPLYQRALEIWERALGPSHSEVATPLNHLAVLYEAQNDPAQAVNFQARANAIGERSLEINLVVGSERQKLAYLATLADQTDYTISLHVRSAPAHAAARALSLTTILQRKARVLDVMSGAFGALRRRFDAQDQALLDELREISAQLAKFVLGESQQLIPAVRQKQIASLEARKEELEAEMSRRSAQFQIESQRVSLEAVQATIPADAALIEYFSFRPFNAKCEIPRETFGQPRYVAYILRRQGAPQWVELGEVKAIDDLVAMWRGALRNPARADASRLARRVDERVMRPVRALLGDSRRLLISPDRMLNLIPFAALRDERDQYLVERYAISYLTSGRDLLRLETRIPSKSGQVIIANPEFGERSTKNPAGQRDVELRPDSQSPADPVWRQGAVPSFSLDRIYFPSLPATAGEAAALKTLLPQASVFIREQATETVLKGLGSPGILHIATHGFFLDDIEARLADTRDVVLAGGGTAVSSEAPRGNPLLRSGLALAGANLRRSGSTQHGDDGVLTAMEAAGLDLWGTKLVVLSACDTGVGGVMKGEGVYGLRRALALAGSETQVMSLWPVSDEATRDLMVAYYRALGRGEGRGDALRRVQLQMLKRKDRRRPFFWASFIQSGEWANLDGER